MERTGARAGSVVVLDAATGGVLAMVNLPGFDPDDRESLLPEQVRNRAVTDLFEPGSTQKLVTVAAALETGLVQPGTLLDIPERIEIVDTVFQDFTEHADRLTVTEIVAHSSNLGTILLGEMLGAQRLHEYMVAFGQGRASGIDFPGEAGGVLRPSEDWCVTTCVAGTSIGYHVSVTALQMAVAYATIANDGLWVQPHFVAEVVDGQGESGAHGTTAAPGGVGGDGAADAGDAGCGGRRGHRVAGGGGRLPGGRQDGDHQEVPERVG